MTAKAVGPFKIKKQITQNTFEIDIPPAIRKQMRQVFHSSELISFDTIYLDTVREGADDHNLLDEEVAELEQALRVHGDSRAGQQPSAVIYQDFAPTAG